jgi:hypothetical protein
MSAFAGCGHAVAMLTTGMCHERTLAEFVYVNAGGP